MNENEFFTFRGYMHRADTLTASMEDYLEMIVRLSGSSGFTRIHDLAAALNVQPPSATRMIQKLAELGYAEYEKYGVVRLSEKGRISGRFLLERHQTVEAFLRLLGATENLLEETEIIEHTVSPQTLKGLLALTRLLQSNPTLRDQLHQALSDD